MYFFIIEKTNFVVLSVKSEKLSVKSEKLSVKSEKLSMKSERKKCRRPGAFIRVNTVYAICRVTMCDSCCDDVYYRDKPQRSGPSNIMQWQYNQIDLNCDNALQG